MAAVKTTTDMKLLVEVEVLDDKTGKTKSKNLSFSKINMESTDDQLLAAGKAISNLQTNALESIKVREDSTLVEGI